MRCTRHTSPTHTHSQSHVNYSVNFTRFTNISTETPENPLWFANIPSCRLPPNQAIANRPQRVNARPAHNELPTMKISRTIRQSERKKKSVDDRGDVQYNPTLRVNCPHIIMLYGDGRSMERRWRRRPRRHQYQSQRGVCVCPQQPPRKSARFVLLSSSGGFIQHAHHVSWMNSFVAKHDSVWCVHEIINQYMGEDGRWLSRAVEVVCLRQKVRIVLQPDLGISLRTTTTGQFVCKQTPWGGNWSAMERDAVGVEIEGCCSIDFSMIWYRFVRLTMHLHWLIIMRTDGIQPLRIESRFFSIFYFSFLSLNMPTLISEASGAVVAGWLRCPLYKQMVLGLIPHLLPTNELTVWIPASSSRYSWNGIQIRM